MRLKCIDFFAGIGAWQLACELVNPISQIEFEPIEFIEINPVAQRILRSHFPQVPIHSDVRSYQPIRNQADVYFISFPCTGTSAAGKKAGLKHVESNLWFQSLRCITLGRPSFVVVENPVGLVDRGLRTIVAGLGMAGYQTEIEIISASECGAPHQRQRVFVVAYTNNLPVRKRQNWCCWSEQIGEHVAIASTLVSYPETQSRSLRLPDGVPSWMDGISHDNWWKFNQPPLESGIEPYTLGRRECVSLYGSSIVPIQAAIALMRVQFLASLAINH